LNSLETRLKKKTWVDRANEISAKDRKHHSQKGDPLDLVENAGWIQFGKKEKNKSPRKMRSQSKSNKK